MTLLSPNHNREADECIAHVHIPTQEERVHASETFDKQIIVAAHLAALHDAYILEMGSHPVSDSPPTPTSPSVSLAGLKPLHLKELKLGKVHRRRVLHGTLCLKSLKIHEVVNVLEDEEGNATNVRICNAVPENCSTAQAQRLFPQGSRVAVREPYLTRFPDGMVGVLVENPLDFVFLWVPELHENGFENGKNNGELLGQSEKTVAKEEDDAADERSKNLSLGTDEKEQVEQVVSVIDDNNSSSRELKLEIQGRAQSEDVDFSHGDDKLETTQTVSRHYDSEDKTDEDSKTQEKEELDCEQGAEGTVREIQFEERELPADYAMEVVRPSEDDGITDTEASDQSNHENSLEEERLEAQKRSVVERETAAEQEPELLSAETVKVDPEANISATELRLKGNRLFAREDWMQAAEMYSRCVQKAEREAEEQSKKSGGGENEVVLGLSNRAEVWLRLKRHEQALEDAERALRVFPDHLKSMFRRGRAMMGLQRYGEALVLLVEVHGRAPTDKDLQAAIAACRLRVERPVKPGKKKRASTLRSTEH